MADSRTGRKGTRRVHGEGRACNSFQIKKPEWWRRGESNDTPLLITRNLLKKRDAQNAITALCPIPMYKIMYNEIGAAALLIDSGATKITVLARLLLRRF